MTLTVTPQTIPLRTDEDGVMRVGETRVTLRSVIHAFLQGHTAEEIVSHYPALRLADVYAVLAYYLNDEGTVKAYLAEEDAAIEANWRTIEANPDYQIFRNQLLSRKRVAERSR
jgi:uncharacterized protein (DUF433 family)